MAAPVRDSWVEHRLLTDWIEREGRGAMARLARAGKVSWVAMSAIVRQGAVPRYDTAKGLAALTGYSVDALIEEAKRCRLEHEARGTGPSTPPASGEAA